MRKMFRRVLGVCLALSLLAGAGTAGAVLPATEREADTGALTAQPAAKWTQNGAGLTDLTPEKVALAIGGVVTDGTGFLHNVAYLTAAELEALRQGGSGEQTYRLGLGDSYIEAPRSYSTYENHGTATWSYHRVLGLDLTELAKALGVDTTQKVTIGVYSEDGMNYALPDAFGTETERRFFSPAGGTTKVGPVLALAQTVVSTENAPGEGTYTELPAAPTADDACMVFGYGQTASDDMNGCNWVKYVNRIRFGAETSAIAAEGKSLALSSILLLGIYQTSYTYLDASGTEVTHEVRGVPLTVLLDALGLNVAAGETLVAAGTGERTIARSAFDQYFVAWNATCDGSAVGNKTALRLYGPGQTESEVVLADLTSFSKAQSEQKPALTDLAGYDWAKDAIHALYDEGIVTGTGAGTFSPGREIKRGDFILMLVRAYGLTAAVEGNFADVKADAYYAEAIAVARALGIAQGDGTYFKPESSITRAEAMALLYRTMAYKGVAPAQSGDLSAYPDAGDLLSVFTGPVSALVGAGIITGSNGLLKPNDPMTRAQLAVALYKALHQ